MKGNGPMCQPKGLTLSLRLFSPYKKPVKHCSAITSTCSLVLSHLSVHLIMTEFITLRYGRLLMQPLPLLGHRLLQGKGQPLFVCCPGAQHRCSINAERELRNAYIRVILCVLPRLREVVESGSRMCSYNSSLVQCTLSKDSHAYRRTNSTYSSFQSSDSQNLAFGNQSPPGDGNKESQLLILTIMYILCNQHQLQLPAQTEGQGEGKPFHLISLAL